MIKPELEGCETIICRCGSKISEIQCWGKEFVPEKCRGIAGDAHGVSLAYNGLMKAFSSSIVR